MVSPGARPIGWGGREPARMGIDWRWTQGTQYAGLRNTHWRLPTGKR